MSENQKLRDALQAIANIDDSTNHTVDASAALDRIGQIARQALALPTADHLPDAGKMIETAAPVGDLADLPRYTAWSHLKTHGVWPEGIDRSWMKDEMGRYNDVTVSNAVIAELRAALIAGDAVDARQRAVHSSISRALQEAGIRNEVLVGMCIEVGLETYDAAMRKGHL